MRLNDIPRAKQVVDEINPDKLNFKNFRAFFLMPHSREGGNPDQKEFIIDWIPEQVQEDGRI